MVPFTQDFQFLSPEEIVEKSLISDKAKFDTLSLIKKYRQFCEEKTCQSIITNGQNDPLTNYFSIYNPDNAYIFVNSRNYKRTTPRKHLQTLLNILKKCTKNPYLSYTFPIGKAPKPKLKHFVTEDELKKLLLYLKSHKLDELFLILELLYKFGIRVGAVSKLKVGDLNKKTQVIVFKEKFGEVIERELLNFTFKRLSLWIEERKLKKDDFIFFPHIKKKRQFERDKYLSTQIKRTLEKSKVFSKEKFETISAHCFRATKAVNIYISKGLEEAAKELGHKSSSTTKYKYIDKERRNIDKNIEETLFSKNDIFKSIIKKGLQTSENNESGDEEEENENIISEDDCEYEKFFTPREGFGKEEKRTNSFVNKKRIRDKKTEEIKPSISSEEEENEITKKDEINEKYKILFIKGNINTDNNNFNNELNVEIKKIFEEEIIKYDCDSFKKCKIDISPKVSSSKGSIFSLNDEGKEILNNLICQQKKYLFKNIYAKKSKEGKIGIYALKNIDVNELICNVSGNIIYEKDIKKEKENSKANSERNFLWSYIKTKNKNYNRIIDQRERANISTYIRAASIEKRNCDIFPVIFNSSIILIVVASRKIKKGEEIIVNYELINNFQ